MTSLTKNQQKKGAWRPDDVEKIVAETLEDLLRGEQYKEEEANNYLQKICSVCTQKLIELKKPFKYIVHAAIAESGEGALNFFTAGNCLPDIEGVVSCIWPEERIHDKDSRGIRAAVRVFCFSI